MSAKAQEYSKAEQMLNKVDQAVSVTVKKVKSEKCKYRTEKHTDGTAPRKELSERVVSEGLSEQ